MLPVIALSVPLRVSPAVGAIDRTEAKGTRTTVGLPLGSACRSWNPVFVTVP